MVQSDVEMLRIVAGAFGALVVVLGDTEKVELTSGTSIVIRVLRRAGAIAVSGVAVEIAEIDMEVSR